MSFQHHDVAEVEVAVALPHEAGFAMSFEQRAASFQFTARVVGQSEG